MFNRLKQSERVLFDESELSTADESPQKYLHPQIIESATHKQKILDSWVS